MYLPIKTLWQYGRLSTRAAFAYGRRIAAIGATVDGFRLGWAPYEGR